MRKLLNTLFVLTEDSYVSKDGDDVVVKQDDKILQRFPLLILENIVCFNYLGASPALIGACAERGIHLCFLTPRGKFLAHCVGKNNGNVLLRRVQFRMADDRESSLGVARMFIVGKIYNSYQVLDRAVRNHGLRMNIEDIKGSQFILKERMNQALSVDTIDGLRGIEGEAAKIYFRHFDDLILQQKEVFSFHVRSRRPPLDEVNALLSFVYMLLTNECVSALESVGLDAYVGFMHTDRPGRASLALDLMEELRPVVGDRLVLTMINKRLICKNHFQHEPTGGVFLNETGRKVVLTEWHNHKKEELKHPYLKEKLQWGLVPYVQALLLSRYLRGDVNDYVPFLWR